MPVCVITSYKLDIEHLVQFINVPENSPCLSVFLLDQEPFISFLTTTRGPDTPPYERVKVTVFLEGSGYRTGSFAPSNSYVGVFVKDGHVFHVFTDAQMRRAY